MFCGDERGAVAVAENAECRMRFMDAGKQGSGFTSVRGRSQTNKPVVLTRSNISQNDKKKMVGVTVLSVWLNPLVPSILSSPSPRLPTQPYILYHSFHHNSRYNTVPRCNELEQRPPPRRFALWRPGRPPKNHRSRE